MNTDLYNRQLHLKEKTLAQQLADKSGGQYTQAQVEDQLRIMGVSVNGTSESGVPTTLIGQTPTDSGAQWISAGTTADGKPILTQVTAQADPQLQSYILANYNSASSGQVPSQFTYALTGNSGSINLTGPFTKFDQSDVNFMRNTTADAASMVSTNAGRVSATAGVAAAVPGPHSVEAAGLSFSAAVVSLAASGVQQLLSPQPWSFGFDSFVDLTTFYGSDRYPLVGPVFTEIGEAVKNSAWANQVKNSSQNK